MENIINLDLNLLVVLWVLLQEKSATRAARRMHVTQSAISNALNRLRDLFADPLFVRSHHGLTPTPRALKLLPLLKRCIAHMSEIVENTGHFDALTCEKQFVVACPDYQQMLIVPELINLMSQSMPKATLRTVTIDYLIQHDGLSQGEVDVLIGIPPEIPSSCLAELLYEDELVCVLRKSHPYKKKQLDIQLLGQYPHIGISVRGKPNRWIDELVEPLIPHPQIKLTFSHFFIGALAIVNTDYVLPFPRLIAQKLCPLLNLRILEVPQFKDLPTFKTQLVWHQRTQQDPACELFRQLVKQATKLSIAVKEKTITH